MTMTRIYDGIAPRSVTFQLLNRYQPQMQAYDGTWSDNPHHRPVEAGQWFEIEGEEYDYFLNILPPSGFDGHAFAISEYITDDLTHAFYDLTGRFFCVTVEITPERRIRDIINQTGRALREAIQ